MTDDNRVSDIQSCKKCGASIRFVRIISGAYMPVEAEMGTELEDNNRHKLIHPDGTLQSGVKAGDQGYTPHWAKCSHAKEFKKK